MRRSRHQQRYPELVGYVALSTMNLASQAPGSFKQEVASLTVRGMGDGESLEP
jgi:hypothetical protein